MYACVTIVTQRNTRPTRDMQPSVTSTTWHCVAIDLTLHDLHPLDTKCAQWVNGDQNWQFLHFLLKKTHHARSTWTIASYPGHSLIRTAWVWGYMDHSTNNIHLDWVFIVSSELAISCNCMAVNLIPDSYHSKMLYFPFWGGLSWKSHVYTGGSGDIRPIYQTSYNG